MSIDQTLVVLAAAAVLGLNALGVLLVALQMPGTWLMLLGTAALAWWRWDGWSGGMIGGWALVALLALAVLGEVVEFVAGAAGARGAGGSKRAAGLAIVGGVAGAVVGTLVLSWLPIIGTLIGAAVGAGLGSLGGDLWAGRPLAGALRSGRGAAVGRFWGALGKFAVAVMMWLAAAAAIVWP